MTSPDSQAAAIAASRRPLDGRALAARLSGDAGPFSQLSVVASSASTNSALADSLRADDDGWPHMSALVADHQTAGRGRAGRGWDTPQGAALTATTVLRLPGSGDDARGWLPLVVGLAVVRALDGAGVEAALKWPNDVVVRADEPLPGWGPWRKVCGILCEVVGGAVIAGVGINVTQTADELPVPHATSLLLAGGATDREALLAGLGERLREAVGEFADGGVAAVSRPVAQVCSTLGQDVTVTQAGAEPVVGRAVGLSPGGGLLVDSGAAGRVEVFAGDVSVRSSR